MVVIGEIKGLAAATVRSLIGEEDASILMRSMARVGFMTKVLT